MVPCSRRGKTVDGAEPVRGTAEVIDDPSAVQRAAGLIRRKYGVEFFIVTTIERILAFGRKPRAVLRVTLAA